MLAPFKDTVFFGESVELRFKKTESFNEYLIEAVTEEHKFALSLSYTEEPIDKDYYKIKINWEIPTDIPHDEVFNIIVTLKHKITNTSTDISELEKLFSVAIYENDQLQARIKVVPFVKIYGDIKKTYIEAIEPFDWLDHGIVFAKGDVFTCKSISKELSLVVKLKETQFKITLWTKEYTSTYVSDQLVLLDCNLKKLLYSTKKLSLGLKVSEDVEKDKLFTLDLKLINYTDSVQSYKIEKFITEYEMSNIGESSKNTKFVHTTMFYNPVELLATQNKPGTAIKLHPTALRIKLGPLKPGECSEVQFQAVSSIRYIHKIIAVRLRDTMLGVLEDVPVSFYIPIQ